MSILAPQGEIAGHGTANEPGSDIEGEVARRMPPAPPGASSGGQAAVPEGSLSKPYFGPQGDEQRDPPAGAPAPVQPAQIVATASPDMCRVASLQDLRDGVIARAKVGETDIILIRDGGQVRAFGASCPHAGAPLDGGAVCHGRLICPWHKAEFRIGDGAVLEPPALDDLMRGRTVVAVAHRLSTLRDFDRIVVMDDGIVVDDGSPEELSRRPGPYRDLLRQQSHPHLQPVEDMRQVA